MRPTMYVITGPTASGKSALAIELARRLDTEIISADSRQIYKGIPIVTEMHTLEEQEAAKHHLINMLPLDAYYSASQFEEDALRLSQDIMARTGSVVVCGGSMMYVDALCNGIDELPTVPDSIRFGLLEEYKERGDEWLREELRRLDPDYYGKVDQKNIKRLLHAVEIIRTAGESYTSLRKGMRKERPFEIRKYMITMPREQLFERINRRVDSMVEAGLIEEARRVYPQRALNSLNTVGLKELFAVFDGEMELPVAIERIKKNTRVYAKKQMTWWQRDEKIIPLDSNVSPDELLRYQG